MDLSPFLRQTVKTQNSASGRLPTTLRLISSVSPFTSKANVPVPTLRRAAPLCVSLCLCLVLPVAALAQAVTTTTVVTAGFPGAMAVNTVTNKIYVASWNDDLGADGGNVTVIDGATNNTTTLQVGNGPTSVAVNPLTNTIYVANNNPGSMAGTVSVIDGATNAITTVATGCSPVTVAVNAVTNQIYVAGYWAGCNLLAVIDGATNTVTSLPAGSNPSRIAINQTTNKIYVGNRAGSSVTVIDGSTNSTTSVPVGSTPAGVSVNETTNKIYVANNGSNTLTVVDGATNNTLSVPVGNQPVGVAVNPVTNKIYVSNFADNTVTVVDGATGNTVTVAVGSEPNGVAVNTETNQIFVANYGYGDNTITVIDGATNATTNVPVAGNQPGNVVVNAVTNMIYVSAGGSGEYGHTDNVTVIDGSTVPVVAGLVSVAPAQGYNVASNTLNLSALVRDTLYGAVTAGTFSFSLTDSTGATQASGQLSYASGSSRWVYSGQPAQALAPGQYQVYYSIATDRGRVGTATGLLSIGGGKVTISGTITGACAGTPVPAAQLALFQAGGNNGLWTLVNAQYNGAVPPLATLLAKLTPAQGPVTSDANGNYSFPPISAGGSYVIVVAAAGYHQNYTYPSFAVPSGVTSLTQDLGLAAGQTLLALCTDVTGLEHAAQATVNTDAAIISSIINQANADNLFAYCNASDPTSSECQSDFWNALAGIYVAGGGALAAANMPPAIQESLSTYVDKSVEITLAKQVGTFVAKEDSKDLSKIINEAIVDQRFPLPLFLYNTGIFQNPQADINNSYSTYLSNASAQPISPQASLTRLRQSLGGLEQQLSEAGSAPVTLVLPPDPANGVYTLTLESEKEAYFHGSQVKAQLGGAHEALTWFQIGGTTAALVSAATGIGVEAAPFIYGAVKVAGVADTLVQAANIANEYYMAATLGTALTVVPEDNWLAAGTLKQAINYIGKEATSPVYSNVNNTYTLDSFLDLNLPTIADQPVLFSFAGLPVGKGSATLTVTNTGNVPSSIRTVASAQATTLLGTAFASQNVTLPFNLAPRGQQNLSIPYLGYNASSLGLLDLLSFHTLSVDSYSGPYLAGSVPKSYWVVNPLALLSGFAGLGVGSSAVKASDYGLSAATSQGRVGVQGIQQRLSTGGVTSFHGILDAGTPNQEFTLPAGSGFYAASLKVFAPQDKLAVLVTDPGGRRLGHSFADGNDYSEFIGTVSSITARPVSLTFARPSAGQYTLEVALLSPGVSQVPFTVVYQPVQASEATMTVLPSVVRVDGLAGQTTAATTQSVEMRIGEVSGQQALTGVGANLGPLQPSRGGPSLTILGQAEVQVGDIPAGDQRSVEWTVAYPPAQPGGKYVGTAQVTSQQTAMLTVPVVALVRNTNQTVSLFQGGPTDRTAAVQESLTLGPNGSATTWVQVPAGFRVLDASLGVAPASSNLTNPSIDIGADGTIDWSFSGLFNFGVEVDNLERAFNAYLDSHPAGPYGWIVPIKVYGPRGQKILLNGIQLYLEYYGSWSARPLLDVNAH